MFQRLFKSNQLILNHCIRNVSNLQSFGRLSYGTKATQSTDTSGSTSRVSKKIQEIEDRLSADPNSPLGRLKRTPKGDVNTDAIVNDHQTDGDNPFAAFEDGVNPTTGERNGPTGPEPTRYGDWERKGRCIDF
ncbi:succinate dehydrogenase assembly factor 4, mitochondrial-like [Oppia nitens]|uniref:succinate dehydrogenase assembly factor 4, mitochondrial-like n=1 Tax=Oppia nitens TaxID=1686743 RepID=UPI0023DC233D|nr:succinate dehydrogenase assembly factor 4, mitochondrial-like [Oppia nitens]